MNLTLRTLLYLLLAASMATGLSAQAHSDPAGVWKFAISGDSRNCGDIVMPAIAAHVRADGAVFYWHLGDFRAIYNIDEDYASIHPQSSMAHYLNEAWPDFIQHQLAAFGDVPVFLGIGNHELGPPMSRADYLAQFADWLNSAVISGQRLADDPASHIMRTYYHWIERGVDFISMDNASTDMFDRGQLDWLTMVLNNAAKNDAVQSVVVGMHEALPDSLSAGHSMNESGQETASGRIAYAELSAFRSRTKKKVYVLASHSHFVMNNVYDTACHKDDVLPGWITGTAGAQRYRLPADLGASTIHQTDVYGYLLATVSSDGTIIFEFKPIQRSDLPARVTQEFPAKVVDYCFTSNDSTSQPNGPSCGTSGTARK